MVFVPAARVVHLRHASNLKDYFLKKYKIGYWKVLVHKKHPRKLIRDSHTPPNLKIQIVILAAALFFLILGVINSLSLRISALFAGLFLITTLPFVYHTWRKDLSLAIVSPLILLIRSAALGLGFGHGLLNSILRPESYNPSPRPSKIRK